MKNNMSDLRDHLFSQIEEIKAADSQKEVKAAIEKSRIINALAKTLVDTANAETAFIDAVGGKSAGSDFLHPKQPAITATGNGKQRIA